MTGHRSRSTALARLSPWVLPGGVRNDRRMATSGAPGGVGLPSSPVTFAERRAAEELAAIGGRAPASGELTPVERRVVELVAAGNTNREVAAALFLSTRTVEGHLSRVYAKLGVHSRVELARKLGGEEGKVR